MMKSRAFTLIELLVVIAIIAVLAGIIFPVFSSARARAATTDSLSKAKQLGTAIELYVSDADSIYPNVADGTPGEGRDGVWVRYTSFDAYTPGKFDLKGGSLFPYVKSEAVYFDKRALGPKTNLSYALSGCMSTPSQVIGINFGVSTSQISLPSSMVLLGEEGVNQNQMGKYIAATNDGYFNVDFDVFSDWHDGKTIALFADTSAKLVPANTPKKVLLFGGEAGCRP